MWYDWSSASGNNSVVECDLAKVEVAGSNPVSRSIFTLPFARVRLFRARPPDQLQRESLTLSGTAWDNLGQNGNSNREVKQTDPVVQSGQALRASSDLSWRGAIMLLGLLGGWARFQGWSGEAAP
jgi:hypothetical protein